MKALIFGENGQIAFELMRQKPAGFEVIAIGRHNVDIANSTHVRSSIRTHVPNIIINAAAYTDVDRAELEPEIAFAVNATAAAVIAEEAASLGICVVHYSTDYVYDGTSSRPYTEDDAVNPLNVYGKSKLEGDLAVQRSGAAHLILRTCWVYAERGNNFLTTMMRLGAERETLSVVDDQRGCPTSAAYVARATWKAAMQLLEEPLPDALSGVYHLACDGSATRHEFATAIFDGARQFKRSLTVERLERIRSGEYPRRARRPTYSVLSCAKIHQIFGIEAPSWRNALEQVLRRIAETKVG